MGFELKASIITASVGNLSERFLPSGYKNNVRFEDKLKKIVQIKGLQGVELCYSPDSDESDAGNVKSLLHKYPLL